MKAKYLSTSNNEPITSNPPDQSGRRESDTYLFLLSINFLNITIYPSV